jgi:cytochrome c oxidase assembly protein subunit 15
MATRQGAAMTSDETRHWQAIRLWLWCVAGLVLLMVVVGGATRLTDSGLSITEWRPVTGALPPLNAADWQAEFEKYRQIPQYELLNKGMTLAEFKVIYWWEWGHRFLGRLIGAAFLLPFLWFLWKGWVPRGLQPRLWVLFALGGLQGAVGWLMVASGLRPGMVAVAPLKLMFHLTLACIIFALLVWVAEGLRRAGPETQDRSARRGAFALVVLLLVQIALGALVAGNDAGLIYNTWPLMDGHLLPPADRLFVREVWIENFVDSHALVQFNHRLGAYALLALAAWHAWSVTRRLPGTSAARGALLLLALIVAQAGIGIMTLLLVVPIWAGLLHQGMAIVVLAVAVVHARHLAPAFVARPATAAGQVARAA